MLPRILHLPTLALCTIGGAGWLAACVTPGDVTVVDDPARECEVMADCPGTDSPCASRTCDEGRCGTYLSPAATSCGTEMQCDGAGECVGCGTECGPKCNNGITEIGEQCDDAGESVDCDADCSFARCGDGFQNVSANEACDDGNGQAGDGCSDSCQVEGTCAAPLPLALNVSAHGLIDGVATARLDGAEVSDIMCGGSVLQAPRRVFEFNLATAESLEVEVISDFDATVKLVDFACSPNGDVQALDHADGCADDYAGPAIERLTYLTLPAGSYAIEVTGKESAAAGTFQVSVRTLGGRSCDAIAQRYATETLRDGIYALDPDGSGPEHAFAAQCAMNGAERGYTLVARFSNADRSRWLGGGSGFVGTEHALGSLTKVAENADMWSPGLFTIDASDFRFTRSDDPNHVTVVATVGGCLQNLPFRQFLDVAAGGESYYPSWDNVMTAGMRRGLQCDLDVAPGAGSVIGFGGLNCALPTSYLDTVSFFAHATDGSGAVMAFGGSNQCNGTGAGLARGIVPSPAASFDSSATDMGDDPTAMNDPYALNLWVR